MAIVRPTRLVAALVFGVGVGALILAMLPPESQGGLPSDATRRAELFEQGLAAAVRTIRVDENPWAIAIETNDVNAWLATRWPLWKISTVALVMRVSTISRISFDGTE